MFCATCMFVCVFNTSVLFILINTVLSVGIATFGYDTVSFDVWDPGIQNSSIKVDETTQTR